MFLLLSFPPISRVLHSNLQRAPLEQRAMTTPRCSLSIYVLVRSKAFQSQLLSFSILSIVYFSVSIILAAPDPYRSISIVSVHPQELQQVVDYIQLSVGMQLIRRIVYNNSKVKVYYPFFLASDYTPLVYSPYYGQKASRLAIDKPNQHQVNYTTLPKFLINQLQQDKGLFVKQKEFLFVGRSNSGKSSLINAIFNTSLKKTRKKIARTSKGPGTTKFLHFHHIQNKQSFIVDAPGYGFAKMNKKRRELWFGLTEEYMKVSSRLSQIFVCINLEHGLKTNDIQFLQRCERYNIDVQVILTKTDKIRPAKYFYHVQAIVEGIKRLNLSKVNQRIIAVSGKTRFGIEVMRMRLIEAIEKSKQRNIDQNEDLLLTYVKGLRVQRTRIEQKQPTQSKQFMLRKLIYQSKLTKYLK